MEESKSEHFVYLFGIAVIVIICKRKANMALLFCATLHVIFSIASGLDADFWRVEIEKRLSSLEQFNVHLQEENANLRSLILETQRENKLLKGELEDVVKRVSKCEEVIPRQEEYTQNNVERATETRLSDDGNEVLTKGKGQPGPRIGE